MGLFWFRTIEAQSEKPPGAAATRGLCFLSLSFSREGGALTPR